MPSVIHRAAALALALTAASASAAHAAPQITQYDLPAPGGVPVGITLGPDGALWYADGGTPGSIGRVDATGAFASPFVAGAAPGFTAGQAPTAIAQGPDGNLWFTTTAGNGAVARITPDGVVTEFPLSQADSQPRGIAATKKDVWFTLSGVNRIARIGSDGTGLEEFAAGDAGAPEDVAFDHGGTLWYTDAAEPGAIGRVYASGTVTEFTDGLTPNARPAGIVAGPDGAMWFTEAAAGKIGRISNSGEIVEYGLPDPASAPTDITVGGDGNLWFTERGAPGRIGRITPAGIVSEYTVGLAPDSVPTGIATGRDGNVWFTSDAAPGRIGRITVGPAILKHGADAVTDRSALFTGVLRPNGQATEYRFEYGSTDAYGAQTVTLSAGDGAAPVPVAVPVDGLEPGTTYRFRLVAVNASETVVSDAKTFTTPPADGSLAAPEDDGRGNAKAAQPKPVHGKTVSVAARGRVLVDLPGAATPVRLEDAASIPVGSVIDTRRGTVRLTSVDGRGRPQTGSFWAGVFTVRQPRGERGMVELVLRGSLDGCRRRGTASAAMAAARKTSRRLWGKDKGGRFRTRGANSVATVRGTRWLVEDRCGSTRTKVVEGSVAVRDLRRKKTVLVRAGRQYVAKAKSPR